MTEKRITLKASGLKKAFNYPVEVTILKGVDLTVFQGDSIAIMGRSGEGKSTLLQILGTLENPSQGTLEIAGQDVTAFNKASLRNRHIAFVFQSFHLLEDYTALENVLMPARIGRQNVNKNSLAYERGMNLLKKVGLEERAHFNAKQLSGGEKQRVAIARALCNDPDIIFADEPTGNLDRQTSDLIQSLLLDFARETKKALIVVTHDQQLADRCDHCYQLVDGLLHKQRAFGTEA